MSVYEAAGDVKAEQVVPTTSTSRRRLQAGETDDGDQGVSFVFDYTVKKFEHELYTFGDAL